MSKSCYLAKSPENFIDFLAVEKDEYVKEKKEENICSKCGAEIVTVETGQGWGFDSVDKCPNCQSFNWAVSKGF